AGGASGYRSSLEHRARAPISQPRTTPHGRHGDPLPDPVSVSSHGDYPMSRDRTRALRPNFPVEHLVARVLLGGGLLGLALIAVGLGLYALHGGFHDHVLALTRPAGAPAAPGVFVSIRSNLVGAGQRPVAPHAVGARGMSVHMATPGGAVTPATPRILPTGDAR